MTNDTSVGLFAALEYRHSIAAYSMTATFLVDNIWKVLFYWNIIDISMDVLQLFNEFQVFLEFRFTNLFLKLNLSDTLLGTAIWSSISKAISVIFYAIILSTES